MSDDSPDFLSAQALIVGRLQTLLVPAVLAAVYTLADLATVNEQTRQSPSAHVIYDGYTNRDNKIGDTLIEVRYLVVLAVRHSQDQATGEAGRVVGSPRLRSIAEALIGWPPDAKHSVLKLVTAPAPAYLPAFGYFPLAFTTSFPLYPQE